MNAPSDSDLERLIDYVRSDRGFDFSGYKRATLGRRVHKRMSDIGAASMSAYVDQLEVSPDELAALFDAVLINVSSFFRDPPVWEYVAHEVIPAIIASKAPGAPIRVWSAGCSSGEEPYTIAMLLGEALGESEFRTRVKIFATDLDEDALNQARLAVYDAAAVESVPEALRERWLTAGEGKFHINADLRRSVIFGRNDLLHDAPISKLDLLACRNTLMYFNIDAQTEIVRRFAVALNEGGYAILGKAEMMLNHNGAFNAAESSLRIFRRVPGTDLRVTRPRLAGTLPADLDAATLRSAIEHGPVAQVVLDAAGQLALMSAETRQLFALTDADIGRPLKDLELSYRPADLRSLVLRAGESGDRVRLPGPVRWRGPHDVNYELEVEVTPLRDAQGENIGMSITFLDATRGAQLSSELERARREADTAYEELQAIVEELETTNEELQSTNEELETTNEEGQSTNEELQTTNEELESRRGELSRMTSRMNAIIHAAGIAVAVVDRELRIEMWNERARDLWGVGIDDVRGTHLLNLDIGLPVGELRDDLLHCVNGTSEGSSADLAARDRRGQELTCSVRCVPLPEVDGTPEGVIVMMEPV